MSESEPQLEIDSRAGEPELRRVIAEYEARLAQVAELAGRVRHDVNNPLTGMIGQTQLLLREPLSDAARRRVQIIEQLAGRIRDTVARLRTVEGSSPETARDGESKEDSPPRR
ncbi:MAG: hypothetical protein LC754_06480 [Acidobacteria bacterium]|nr:hypothetical protein [Acidobacteriota bacterium]